MADESRSLEDEILALIIVHEPLLRHIIRLEVDNPTDRDDVYQETMVAILEGFRKGTPESMGGTRTPFDDGMGNNVKPLALDITSRKFLDVPTLLQHGYSVGHATEG